MARVAPGPSAVEASVGEVQGFVWRTDRPLQTLHAVDMSHRE
jgi:hypothetical protein